MEFRSVIERAKGILMERYELTADQGVRVLADASMRTNLRVRDVAEGEPTPRGGVDRNPARERRPRPPRGGEHR